jgi:hypothetical protein
VQSAGRGSERGEALAVLAAEGAQPGPRLFGLDPLSHHLHAELVGEGHDGAHDRQVPLRLLDARDEGAVDLQDVYRETVEVVERGVPLPKSSR